MLFSKKDVLQFKYMCPTYANHPQLCNALNSFAIIYK